MKILLVEDNPGDALLFEEYLREGAPSGAALSLSRASSLREAMSCLGRETFEVVVLDLGLSDSQGLATFRAFSDHEYATVPIIVLTGLSDNKVGMEAVKLGAQDYMVKNELEGRLLWRSLSYAVERHRLLMQLQDALQNIKVLKGLLPICSSCKKIRDDMGYWNQIETYLHEHSEAQFSHGICPDCIQKLYPEVAGIVLARIQERAPGQVSGEAYFSSLFKKEWARCLREGKVLSLLLVQVKGDNRESSQHREVEQALRRCIHRPGDHLAGYKDSVFALLLGDTPGEGVRYIAGAIHAELARINSHRRTRGLSRLALCLGGATVLTREAMAPESLTALAEKALAESLHGSGEPVVIISYSDGPAFATGA
jgi:CheY-like chemotaxis protein